MSNPFGPWATSIDAGGNPQLSQFWRRRMTRLAATSRTSPVLSRRNLLWLGAAAAMLLLPPTLCLTSAAADEEKPGVLIYQVEPKSPGTAVTAADMDKLLKAVQQRLEAGKEPLAKVRKLDDRRIEVALVQLDEANRERVKRLLARPGTLEFRILANTTDHKALIERARKDESKNELFDRAGQKVAWWVPVRKSEARMIESLRDVAIRRKTKDNVEVMEILVVSDAYNVTGDYLVAAESKADQSGRPSLDFRFSKKGGELFGKLTGDNLPDPENRELTRKLGIILDGELFSAPSIQARISDSGQITGSFTKEEVADLASILNAGSLPVRIRLVEKISR